MKVERLFIYPIKSCGGIEVDLLNMELRGPTLDRRYVLVDDNGLFISQRRIPKMCLIKVSMHVTTEGIALRVEAPRMKEHSILTSHGESIISHEFKDRTIVIHKDKCVGTDLGDKHAEWFSKFLDLPCRLVRQVSRYPRTRTPSSFGKEIEVSFADAYPILITTLGSLSDLNKRIAEKGGRPVPMDRFRPNIVLSGAHPYAEDSWRRLRIGKVSLTGAKKCVRCSTTLVDQRTGKTGKEPIRTLALYRNNGGEIEFGRNFLIDNRGLIHINESVEVTL